MKNYQIIHVYYKILIDEANYGEDGYGKKASDTLVKVRGKDFRHEKTKKKRGGYRGGTIDPNATKSIKFDDDE